MMLDIIQHVEEESERFIVNISSSYWLFNINKTWDVKWGVNKLANKIFRKNHNISSTKIEFLQRNSRNENWINLLEENRICVFFCC